MIAYVEICAIGNVPIYYKATAINMQNIAVAGGNSDSGPYFDSNIKTENKTYASHTSHF